MPTFRSRVVPGSLAVPLLLAVAFPVHAQIVPDAASAARVDGDAMGDSPGERPPSAVPGADGLFTVGFIVGPGLGGIERGLRVGIGFPGGGRARIDLVATVSGSTSTADGAELTVGQGSVELVVSRRRGRVRPWLGGGFQGGRALLERAGTPTGPPCIPGTIVCAPGDWTTAGEEAEGTTSGPVLSAGAHLAATERFLLAIEVRKAFARTVSLSPVGEDADLGSVRVLASAIWRLGRPAAGPR